MALVNDLEEFEVSANPEHKKTSELAQISLKLEVDLLEAIKKAAKAEGRLILSEQIRALLKVGLEAKGIKIS